MQMLDVTRSAIRSETAISGNTTRTDGDQTSTPIYFMRDLFFVLLCLLISPPGFSFFFLQETEAGEGARWNAVEDSVGGPTVREPQ